MPSVTPRSAARAAPLSRMVTAMRAKSPFSQSALFGFMRQTSHANSLDGDAGKEGLSADADPRPVRPAVGARARGSGPDRHQARRIDAARWPWDHRRLPGGLPVRVPGKGEHERRHLPRPGRGGAQLLRRARLLAGRGPVESTRSHVTTVPGTAVT